LAGDLQILAGMAGQNARRVRQESKSRDEFISDLALALREITHRRGSST
jgi:hypothetical protein